eukprot:scaffold84281_cov33-Phaeocystis_antarctica.AAC.3
MSGRRLVRFWRLRCTSDSATSCASVSSTGARTAKPGTATASRALLYGPLGSLRVAAGHSRVGAQADARRPRSRRTGAA